MFVIEVIPLSRGMDLESLSYFSSTEYAYGTMIQIPVRGRNVTGIVIESKGVSSTKTALKAATFSLRKLPPQPNAQTLSPHLLATAEAVYRTLPCKRGAVLFSLLPPDVRSGDIPYPYLPAGDGHEDSTPQILCSTRPDRFISYQGIIRSAFAHRGSVLLVVPTAPAVEAAYALLSPGISERVVCFSPHQSKKTRLAAYQALGDESKAILTITTPAFAYLDRTDYTTIIVEGAGSPHYVERNRPYLDHRQALTHLAKTANRAIILGDTFLRTEDEWLRRSDIYQTYGEHPKRHNFTSELTIVTQTDKPSPEVPFTLFSPELRTRMKNALEGRHNVFLFAARRGLAPVVVCIDCGYIFRCPDSGTPYSLLRTFTKEHVEERWFVSSTSGRRVRAADVCTDCGSWRLRERGIGIQQIEDECRSLFPNTPLHIFDHTTAKTHKQATTIQKTVAGSKGAILLGTQMALPYLPGDIHLSAVVSLDAVRAVPSWRADESLFRLIMELRERTTHEVMVQTRSETDDLLIYASRGAIDRFYDDEITLREMLKYPPFTSFFLLSYQGGEPILSQTEAQIKQLLTLAGTHGEFYTNPQSQAPKLLRHCLVRLARGTDAGKLVDALRHLPPYITIARNPDRIV
jgi:primosomal protein N'